MAEAHAKYHDYHLVDPSPWPLTGSLSAFAMAVGAIAWMKTAAGGVAIGNLVLSGPYLFYAGLLGVLLTMFLWWRDVIREAHKGDHTPVVQLHFRYGMLLFIASEVMFFVAWFWGYFDAALFTGQVDMVDRTTLTGGVWPPVPSANFSHTFDPWGLPLVNTLILLTSGATVTWAHHSLLENNRSGLIWGLVLTVLLGLTFTTLQAVEYAHAGFTFAGHIYGSTFFMATGFHGAHVIIGTLFLLVCLFRALGGDFTPKQHFGFEAAAWYWHFVDVVWLFLFACIYVWGAGSGGEAAAAVH
ncbi:MAG: cytochrome c oxidase subunit 3 [Hyphomicrobiaceae bacterium]